MLRRYFTTFVLAGVLLPSHVMAAVLYIDPPAVPLSVDDTAVLSVRIDVDESTGECVNLFDTVITHSDFLQVVDTSIGNSILRVWVEEPTIHSETRTVSFAGGIPNGYCGRIQGDPALTNVIAQVVVRVDPDRRADIPADGVAAEVALAPETTVYLNDGRGTIAPLERYGTTLVVSATGSAAVADPWLERVRADTTPPEPFSIQLERSDNVFNGRYYIVFSTTDKQTGIASYEVMEEPLADQSLFRFGAVGAPWVTARSPYVLQDQTLNSTIRVRATDKAGNQYTATLVPDPSLRERQTPWFDWIIVASGSILLVALGAYVAYGWRQRQRRRAASINTASDQDVSSVSENDNELHDTQN